MKLGKQLNNQVIDNNLFDVIWEECFLGVKREIYVEVDTIFQNINIEIGANIGNIITNEETL